MTTPLNNAVAHHLLATGCDEAICQKNVQCCSHSVSHSTSYGETVIQKNCNDTHMLKITGRDIMRLPYTQEYAMLLTS